MRGPRMWTTTGHTPPGGPPPGRVRGRAPGRRTAVAAAAAGLMLAGASSAWAVTGVTEANTNKLVARGPVDTTNGFPTWYQDSGGRRLELCLDGDNPYCGFLAGDIPDDTSPISFPENFPE